jgi:nitrogenase molybdenum-iron protein NifN
METIQEHNRLIDASKHFVSTRNACKLCAPLGASIAFRGIENCVPLIHGSQGCSTYIRRYVISHFKEPVDIASSNFSESTAIFGGGDNLKKALDNVIRQYTPDAVGIATTCLSETIGDDVHLFLNEYMKSKKGEVLPALIHASTPSYQGTHAEGFHSALLAAVKTLAENNRPCDGSINVISGFLSSEDIRYLREMLLDLEAPFILLPDYSETLDGGAWQEYRKISSGGTPVAAIRGMGRAAATIQLGASLKGRTTAASYLYDKFAIPVVTTGLPIGIRQTDRFFEILLDVCGLETPDKYAKERSRLVDAYIDGHKYVFGRRAVVYGEADLVASLCAFLDEIGISPVLCATGAPAGSLEKTIKSLAMHSSWEIHVKEETDFASMLDICNDLKPDIVIGNSKGYYLSRRLGIPLVRVGFPVHDRVGGQRILHIG